MTAFKDLRNYELLKMDIKYIISNFGVSGYLHYKLIKNPEFRTKEYLEIREELFKDLSIQMLYEINICMCENK